ncbi:MAG: DNA mismatch repair protein MutS [Deltaproteobacteria bacterium]|nr:DNA mismatch repair protein MutS [Deltaproteobacteria bacterium]
MSIEAVEDSSQPLQRRVESGAPGSPVPTPARLTPMMRQYLSAKSENPDALLMFRLGDFYELFFEDATIAARLLNLTLTSRDKGDDAVPMCGVPHHAATTYVARLNAAGYRVALCDQVEDPKAAKGIVRREVTRVATPGVPLSPDAIDVREPNFFLAIARAANAADESFAYALVEPTTGEMKTRAVATARDIKEAIAIFGPKEILVARDDADSTWVSEIRAGNGTAGAAWTTVEAPASRGESASAAAVATALAIDYVAATSRGVAHLAATAGAATAPPVLDVTAVKNLEIVAGPDGRRDGSLLASLDETVTPMGARLVRSRLLEPLTDKAAIDARLDDVERWFSRPTDRDAIRRELRGVNDIERLVGKACVGNLTPRDLLALANSLRSADLVRTRAGASFDAHTALATRIATTLVDEPPLAPGDGGLIRRGVRADIDELQLAEENARGFIATIESRERERTGITSLKVRYNRVFGFVIEVTKTHLARVPSDYERRQTIAGGERFVTAELKREEEKVLHAHERRAALELALFEELRAAVVDAAATLRATAFAIADIDVATALAHLAATRNFVRPTIVTEPVTSITDGRHVVLERVVAASGARFVPNSVTLDASDQQILILTGPNMAGKSTVMRQTAIIHLLAQVGSFVPAKAATLGIVDRLFTRVGAHDELTRGQSTFMVEMTETSRILARATRQSLIVLDELGRGTSTFDGISIAWAVAEQIHDRIGARTLFATHYHELADLPHLLPRAKNAQLAVREWNDNIIFLWRLVDGAAGRSYGIQVARLAALPTEVIARAQEILAALEESNAAFEEKPTIATPPGAPARRVGRRSLLQQLTMFGGKPAPHEPVEPSASSALESELQRLELDRLTPLEALETLYRLKKTVGDKKK